MRQECPRLTSYRVVRTCRCGRFAADRQRWTLRFSAEVLPRFETSSYSML